jgi:hypothetical protein
MHAEGAKRRTLQRSDVAAVIHDTYIFDFLVGGGGAPARRAAGPGFAGCEGGRPAPHVATLHPRTRRQPRSQLL